MIGVLGAGMGGENLTGRGCCWLRWEPARAEGVLTAVLTAVLLLLVLGEPGRGCGLHIEIRRQAIEQTTHN